jgi:alkylation response protein AidB-like acyl-CoA dehydrogenase
MKHELSNEQLLMQDSIQNLIASKFVDKTLSFDDKWKIIASTDIIKIAVDKEKGGLGLGAFDLLLALESLSTASNDNGLNFAIAAHTLACVIPIAKYGSEFQINTLIPSLMNGTHICANAMTESESGSTVYELQTKATELDENTFRINGTKIFITNGAVADYILSYAETTAGKGFFGGISAFILDKNNFTCIQNFDKMGLESASLSEIFIDNKTISHQSLLGKKGAGGVIFNESMEWERTCIAGLHIGAMERVMKQVIDFAKTRKSGSQSISKNQAIAHAIVDMQVMIDTSRSIAYSTARMIDKKLNASRESSTTKLYVSECVKKFMLQAQSIFGAYGYIKEYGIEKEVRDALASSIYSGTNEIQKNIIASNLGL